MEKIKKKHEIVASCNELSGHLPGSTEENYEELSKYSPWPVWTFPVYVYIHKYRISLFSEVLKCSYYRANVYITNFTQHFVYSHLSSSVTVLNDKLLNISAKYNNCKDKCYVMDVYVILKPSGHFIYQDV